ncbi:translation initiation factor IF-3 [Patescibacteria group bacterium]
MPINKPRVNNQIKSSPIRVIDQEGNNLGAIPLEEALQRAQEAGSDLIEVAAKANPPVARIMDFGKYQYQKEKEARQSKKKIKEIEVRGIRVRLGISAHDMELKAKKAAEFLQDGDQVRIEFILRGREKYLDKGFINERLQKILGFITSPYTILDGPKKGPRGLIVTIQPTKNHDKNQQSIKKEVQSNEIKKGSVQKSGSVPL